MNAEPLPFRDELFLNILLDSSEWFYDNLGVLIVFYCVTSYCMTYFEDDCDIAAHISLYVKCELLH